MTSKKKPESTTGKKGTEKPQPVSSNKLTVLAIAGLLIVIVVVGSAVVWEKYVEPKVGVDLPNEIQETSEASSMLPYICEQDPEACDKSQLTFQGDDQESEGSGRVDNDGTDIAETEDQEDLSGKFTPFDDLPEQDAEGEVTPERNMLQALEAKLEGLDQLDDIAPLKQKVELLTLLTLVQQALHGTLPFSELARYCRTSPLAEARQLAQGLPEEGGTIHLLGVYQIVATPESKKDYAGGGTFWEEALAWLSSAVQIRKVDNEEQDKVLGQFQKAVVSQDYGKAKALYASLTPEEQEQAYPYLAHLEAVKKLYAIQTLLLTLIARR